MINESVRTLIDELLEDQQQLTAVERFSKFHDEAPAVTPGTYRDLIPLGAPKEGEQYAFEVDLDACSGCKACVVACHSLNGLDESESWRDIGTLIGEKAEAQVHQTVTTACHHCADPACLNGCPTRAYEKDKDTGVVRHLDDQCIGCRYCELKCPYGVPKYNERLGIVRKCDMCHGRIAQGEAPACVQACPNEAIKIRVVKTAALHEASWIGDSLVPGAVSNGITVPSTNYLNLSRNSKAIDSESIEPAHSHLPLVWMLAFTQAGVGVMIFSWLAGLTQSSFSLSTAIVGGLLFFSGLVGSVLHLGQPLKAWKAFLGWRTSWLSREIICFGAFGGLSFVFIFLLMLKPVPPHFIGAIGALLPVLGSIAVWTSVKVYSDTRRPFWSVGKNSLRFGCAMLAFGLIASPWSGLAAIPIAAALLLDLAIARGAFPELDTSTRLMNGQLRAGYLVRVLTAVFAMVALGFPVVSFVSLLVSELAARYLFFRAVEEPSMPGV